MEKRQSTDSSQKHAFSTRGVLKFWGGWRHGLLSGKEKEGRTKDKEGRTEDKEGRGGKTKATNSFIHIS